MKENKILDVKNNSLEILSKALEISNKNEFNELSKKLDSEMLIAKDFKIKAPLIGPFSAGKSSLLNGYLGIDYLPVAITIETAVACELVSGNKDSLDIIESKDKIRSVNVNELNGLKYNSCEYVRMYLKNDKLKSLDDIILVDMPGIDSGYEQHNQAIKNYLNKGSYFIILMDIDNGVPKASLLDFIKELGLYKINFALLISKSDQKHDDEIKEIIDHVRDTILQNTGEEIFVGAISSFNSNFNDMDTMLKNMEVVSLAKNSLYNSAKTVLENILVELERKIKYNNYDESSINKEISELDSKLKQIDKTINKEAHKLKSKVNDEIVDSVSTDVSTVLSQNIAVLIDSVKKDSSELSNKLNQITRPVIISSLDKKLRTEFEEVYENLNLEMEKSLGDLYIPTITSSNIKEINVNIDKAIDSLLLLAQKYLPTAGIVTAGTLVSVAAASAAVTFASVALPVIGALIAAAIPLIGNFIKSQTEEDNNNKIKNAILTQVIPQILTQIKSKLQETVGLQTEAFISAVKEKFEEEKKSINDALNQAKENKLNNQNENKKLVDEMKKDREIIKGLISKVDL